MFPTLQSARLNPQITITRNGQIASSVLFVITGIALGVLYALNPEGFLLPTNYPAFAIIGSVAATALLVFVINTVIRMRKDCKTCEVYEQSSQNHIYPIQLVSSSPCANTMALASNIPQVEPDNLDPLSKELFDLTETMWNEIIALVFAFNAAYYRASGKQTPEHVEEIRAGLDILKSIAKAKVIEKLQDKSKFVLFGISKLLPDLIQEERCRKATPEELIANLPNYLVDPSREDSAVTDPTEKVAKQEVFGLIQEVMLLIAARENLAQDKQYLEHLQAWKNSYAHFSARYNAINQSTKNDKSKRTPEQIKEINKLTNTYFEKRDALFNYLIETTTLTAEQAEKWAPHILNATTKCSFSKKLSNQILPYLNAFGPEGFIGTIQGFEIKALIWGATTAPGKTCDIIKEKIVEATPEVQQNKPIPAATQGYIDETMRAAKILLTALAYPVYYATCPKNYPFNFFSTTFHPLYTEIQALCAKEEMAPPVIDPTNDWQVYLKGYTAYIKSFSEQLNRLFRESN